MANGEREGARPEGASRAGSETRRAAGATTGEGTALERRASEEASEGPTPREWRCERPPVVRAHFPGGERRRGTRVRVVRPPVLLLGGGLVGGTEPFDQPSDRELDPHAPREEGDGEEGDAEDDTRLVEREQARAAQPCFHGLHRVATRYLRINFLNRTSPEKGSTPALSGGSTSLVASQTRLGSRRRDAYGVRRSRPGFV